MRYTVHLIVPLASSLILLLGASCGHSPQGESNTNNTHVVEESIIIPISEININGTWESKDNPLYPILDFKGKSTVVIKTIMGPFASSYERDEEYIRVRTDQSDLLFEIINEDSIVGSGFAKGLWIKKK